MKARELMRSVLLALVVSAWIAYPVHAASVSGSAGLAGKGSAGDAVIYLEGDRKATPLPDAMVDQRNRMFIPHVSVITVGTTVRFPNNDTVFHNVFAYFQAKRFDLGMYPRGATKTETFSKPGLVALLCNIHSNMSAYIMVVDTPYYAVCDKSGRFVMKDVPPGTYTLHAWHESGATTVQQVHVAAGDNMLTLSLTRE
jgi:plastocyanin